MSYETRAGRGEDSEALFTIRCSVKENHQSREELNAIGVTVDSVRDMIESGNFVTRVAEVEGVPVGFTMAEISDGYFFACFVRPGAEGQGIGKALMMQTEAELISAGVTEAWLSTGPGEALRAVGFYEHLGWERSGVLDDGQIRFTKHLSKTEQGR
ncbi:MAG: GNAT family N-acetyltransferase [Pseudomonadota bacterium]